MKVNYNYFVIKLIKFLLFLVLTKTNNYSTKTIYQLKETETENNNNNNNLNLVNLICNTNTKETNNKLDIEMQNSENIIKNPLKQINKQINSRLSTNLFRKETKKNTNKIVSYEDKNNILSNFNLYVNDEDQNYNPIKTPSSRNNVEKTLNKKNKTNTNTTINKDNPVYIMTQEEDIIKKSNEYFLINENKDKNLLNNKNSNMNIKSPANIFSSKKSIEVKENKIIYENENFKIKEINPIDIILSSPKNSNDIVLSTIKNKNDDFPKIFDNEKIDFKFNDDKNFEKEKKFENSNELIYDKEKFENNNNLDFDDFEENYLNLNKRPKKREFSSKLRQNKLFSARPSTANINSNQRNTKNLNKNMSIGYYNDLINNKGSFDTNNNINILKSPNNLVNNNHKENKRGESNVRNISQRPFTAKITRNKNDNNFQNDNIINININVYNIENNNQGNIITNRFLNPLPIKNLLNDNNEKLNKNKDKDRDTINFDFNKEINQEFFPNNLHKKIDNLRISKDQKSKSEKNNIFKQWSNNSTIKPNFISNKNINLLNNNHILKKTTDLIFDNLARTLGKEDYKNKIFTIDDLK